MKKIFLICTMVIIGMIFNIVPFAFVSENVNITSSPITIQTIQNSIFTPIKTVFTIYSSLISYTLQLYGKGGAAVYLGLKNRLVEPPPPPLINDQITIITGPSVEVR